MKREDLKELGLNDDQISSVMANYGKSINEYKEQVANLTSERDALKGQITDRDGQLETLKKSAGKDNDDLKQQIKDLQDANKANKEKYQQQIASQAKSFKIEGALRDAKARNVKTVLALIDTDKVSVGDDGKLVGLNDQIEAAKRSDGYLFAETSKPKVEINNGFKLSLLKR
ncbi:phage scaffolding protein [Lactobacillus alvi]|uniref:Phage scaffolding protein n=1 Tax=Limosilactobacillus alvi TaxID=990412 RepID=A0ABS2EMY5_9LACO|nr:phage scaffolding protein [Limosilactobacillus alvi]MBM6753878.1 phage scaffolding protein [Limosilactobacillus alvi]